MNRQEFINKQKIKILKLKLSLEKPFITDLKDYFKRQEKVLFSNRNDIVDIKPILDKQYKRISNNVIKRNKKAVNKIDEAVETFLIGRAKKQSNYITDTTRKDIEKSIKYAREELAKENIYNPSSEVLMKIASRIFRSLSISRPNTIAITETSSTVENTKRVIVKETHDSLKVAIVKGDSQEAQDLADYCEDITSQEVVDRMDRLDPFSAITMVNNAVKTWATMGDAKVREWHNEADGQTVGIDEPFMVMGEMLMFPSDDSLGASAGNIVNCRCSAIY
jgi:uncharacterized protein with gpF-like domain